MQFDLPAELSDEIIFSMEDQSSIWYIDSTNCSILSDEMKTELRLESESEEDSQSEDRFYMLPRWTSEDGYELMADFTNNLHSPLARTDLRRVLNSGRGVFRNFKDVLKKYPEVEKKWFSFKNQKMGERVAEWYNSLRESWGMERLESESGDDFQETDELLENDFVFSDWNFSKDQDDLERGIKTVSDDFCRQSSTNIDRNVVEAIAFLQDRLSKLSESSEKSGLVCRTPDGEFSACILAAKCPLPAENTVFITDFFVVQKFRGLGIARTLLSKCIEHFKASGIRWIFISDAMAPDVVKPLLEHFGFFRAVTGYAADLSVVF